jgi:alpha-tubulin suppressor-like RCC1 family protein
VGQLGHNSTSAYRVPATTELYGKTIVAVTAGDSHSLALDSNGVLYSWGSNSDGQLGNNSTTSSSVPIVVNTTSGVSALHGKTVVAIAAGIKFSMALASDGTVATWGADEGWGKLGNGSSEARSVPVAVSTSGALAGKTITAIAAGQDHCLALASDGTLYAWGCSHHGRLGSNVYFNPSTPVAVPMTGVLAGKTIVRIAAGAGHGLALASDGVLVGWGLNYNGQVGSGSTEFQLLAPVLVNLSGALAGKTLSALAAGREHSVALASDGTMYAWGMGEGGRLGNGLGTDSLVPVAVSTSGVLSGRTLTAIATGASHSLALANDGTVYAWGTNSGASAGALGDGTSTNSLVPVAVSTTSGISALAGATVLRLSTSVVAPFSLVVASSPLGVPNAPVIVSANAADGQVTVTFHPPSSTGGATVTGYAVTANPGGGIVMGTS